MSIAMSIFPWLSMLPKILDCQKYWNVYDSPLHSCRMIYTGKGNNNGFIAKKVASRRSLKEIANDDCDIMYRFVRNKEAA